MSDQRHALRRQLQAQRELIAQRLGPGGSTPTDYPRSMTMRLLGHRPGMVVSLVTGLVSLFRHR